VAEDRTPRFDQLVGRTADVEHAYAALTERGWKIDTEESNLLQGFSRTWRDHGLKVWVFLEDYACAPPSGEAGTIASVTFYRFDPAAMPTTTMAEALTGPDDEPRGASWYNDWQWLLDHGDPQYATFDALTAVAPADVPPALGAEAWRDLVVAFPG